MKKNPRDYKVNGKQFSYVLDCISDCSYIADGYKTCEDDKSLVSMFFSCYEEEFNYEYNKIRFPNEADRIGDYLQGLPGCMNFDFYPEDIIKVGKSCGYCKTEKQCEKFVENWFTQLGVKLLQLKRHFDIAC